MLKKVILIIFDGLGDRPVDILGGLTPLEAVNTKNFDKLVKDSECGLMHTLGRGIRPGSDVSHLAIFGYAPEKFYSGRGPIEVAGLGLELKHGDLAIRGNFGTVDENMIIKDRRAGRIRDVKAFARALDGIEIDGVKFIIKPGTGHRAGVIMRGENLSSEITDADPHEVNKPVQKVLPKIDSPHAKFSAEVLNKFLAKAHGILNGLEDNKKRIANGDLPANFLLMRGVGQYNALPGFKDRYGFNACCIAGGGLYKGIGAFLGMKIIDVPGATGMPDTDIRAKFNEGMKQLKKHDFIFIHVKATDSLGEDGNPEGKRDFIERIDEAISIFHNLPEDTLLVTTADHSTPCELSNHSADPVPIMFHGKGVRTDKVTTMGERSFSEGGLGFIEGKDVMPQVQNLLGKLHLTGG